jgi:hypothetical protein
MEAPVQSLEVTDLSDNQQIAVAQAIAAIQPGFRDAFLRDILRRLCGREVGDGSVGRAIREAFSTGQFHLLHTVAIGKFVGGASAPGRGKRSKLLDGPGLLA